MRVASAGEPSVYRSAALVACLLLFPSCSDSPSGPTPSFDVRLTIPLGQTLGIEGTRLGVRFDAVVEDSRCPANAMCVWEGRAIVKVTLRGISHEATVDLHSNVPALRSATLDGVRIEWLRLDPYPYAGADQPAEEYRVTLKISR